MSFDKKVYMKEYRANNREKIKKQKHEWYLANAESEKENAKTYRLARLEHVDRKDSEWKKNNRDKCNSYGSKYRASRINATPSWANDAYMKLWYTLAQIEQERTGRRVEVDHIVPLQGKNVCGLHHEHNMQLLFREHNSSKGNKYIT